MSKRMAIYSRVSTERQTVANQASEGGDSIFLVLVSVSERYLRHWLISPNKSPNDQGKQRWLRAARNHRELTFVPFKRRLIASLGDWGSGVQISPLRPILSAISNNAEIVRGQ